MRLDHLITAAPLPPAAAAAHSGEAVATAPAGPDAPALLGLWALALGQPTLETMATAVTAALAERLGCGRVSLALRDRTRAQAQARVVAMSSGAELDPRRQAVRQLAAAAHESLDAGESLLRPGLDGLTGFGVGLPAVAHDVLLRAQGVAAVLSAPLPPDAAHEGALIFEWPVALDATRRQAALDAALFIGPLLLLKAQTELNAAQRVRRALAHVGDAPAGEDTEGPAALAAQRRRRQLHLAAGAAALALLVAGLWPQAHHVVAPVRVEGEGQRIVAAPADGFLHTLQVQPGARVRAGQVLATLDDRDATADLQHAVAERRKAEQDYADALTRDDAAAIAQAQAKLAQGRALAELAQSRMARAAMLAPFDGEVISGDLAQRVGGPVQRGQPLFIVAPGTGWRLVAEVDEADAPLLAPAQPLRVLFPALPGDGIAAQVERIAPVATVAEGRNVFETQARLPAGTAGLTPGLRGLARIEVGRRPPLVVWAGRAGAALQRVAWRVMA